MTQEYKDYVAKYNSLRQESESWRPHWKEISEYMMPRQSAYLTSTQDETDKGRKKNQKIINGSSKDALRIIGAGLQGGLTSPSRPWFALGVEDSDLMQYDPVRQWLHTVRTRLLTIFAKSNFYGSVHGIYQEMAAFGTAAMLIDEDFRTVIRCRPFTIGEYNLAVGSDYRVNTLFRQFSMTAAQMVQAYGKDAVSDKVLDALANNNFAQAFEVVHGIQPNGGYESAKMDARGKKFESVSFEYGTNPEKFLKVSGYNSVPFVAPRWEVTGTSVYGGCPGMDALADAKMLQKMEEKKLKGLDKQIDPPMNAPMSMKSQGGTIVAGGVNYIDTQQGGQGFVPTYQVQLDFQNIAYEIDRVEQRIRRFFFNDLFLSILSNDKRMTATEVAERHEEKLLMLGPVIERLQPEFLDITIDRTFEIAMRFGLLPPPPKELEGMDLKIDYISILAQAQKMVGVSSIEQTATFLGGLAQLKPDVLDKFDADEAVDIYSEAVGAPPKIIRTDEQVAAIRNERVKQQQAQAKAEQAMAMTQGAKNLAQAPMGQGNALDRTVETLM